MAMEIVRLVLLLFHLLGFAAMLGGFFLQMRMKQPEINSYMLGGAIGQLVTGVGLVWARQSLDLPVINAKMGAKLAIDVVIAVVTVVGMRQSAKKPWVFYTAGILTGVAAIVAVFWR